MLIKLLLITLNLILLMTESQALKGECFLCLLKIH